MHDYLLSTEWIRFAFVFGVVVSMVMYEKYHVTSGSIVVPGYIAVFMVHPLVLVATFLNAFITYALVNKVLRRHFLLYGRTKFTLLAIISTTIQTGMLRIAPSGQWLWERDIPLFIGVGYIIPALIAHDMARQGVWKTTKLVLVAGIIVAAPIAAALAADLPGVSDLAPVDGFGRLAFSPRWFPIAILLSIVASWAVANNFKLRSGGFVGAALVGMFMADPWQVAAALSIALVTWLVVSKILMNHMILFGRRKFSAMLLVSSVIAWVCLWVGDRFLDGSWEQHLGVGSLALTPLLLPGLIANDAQRTSPLRVLSGMALAGSFAVTTTWWIRSSVTGETLHVGWKVVAVMCSAVLFAKQFGRLASSFEIWAVAAVRDLAPSGGRRSEPAAVYAMVGHSSTPDPPMSWNVWSERYPDLARDAEEWVSSQLAKLAGPADRPVVANGHPEPDPSTAPNHAPVHHSGVWGIPIGRMTSRPIEAPAYQSVAMASETSDAALREAQPAASDVSAESLDLMDAQ